ncbi:MAG TPA: hypothetical protein ENH82_00990 [bacterium]|nr:hypothetical protein [bacterium]
MRFYISHSIRGKYGKDATATQMKENCDAIKVIAKQLRDIFPTVDFYLPADHEDFVSIAYCELYLTEKEILDIDCKIIERMCDAVIVYVPEGDELQGGRLVEYDFAIEHFIPVMMFSEIEQAVSYITCFILRA